MSIRTFLTAVLVSGVVLAGCGGDDAGPLDDQVAEVRSAVDAGDRAAAETALDDLAIAAVVAAERGEITDEQLDEVADRIASSRALLDPVIGTTPTTAAPTTTTTTTTTSTTEPGKRKGQKKDQESDAGDKGDKDDD